MGVDLGERRSGGQLGVEGGKTVVIMYYMREESTSVFKNRYNYLVSVIQCAGDY